jgi:hypothetical protein
MLRGDLGNTSESAIKVMLTIIPKDILIAIIYKIYFY